MRWIAMVSLPVWGVSSAIAASVVTEAVGYVTIPTPVGYSLVSVPLGSKRESPSDPGTAVKLNGGSFMGKVDSGAVLERWSVLGYTSYTFVQEAGSASGAGVWTDSEGQAADVSLTVGEGLVLKNPGPQTSSIAVGYVRGYDESYPDNRAPVEPAAPGIYLRGSVLPTGGAFEDVMGHAPGEGDAFMRLTTAGVPLISRFTQNGWLDSFGNSTPGPFFTEGQSAFFDTTGGQFQNFVLPNGNVVPESGTAVLMAGAFLLISGFRERRKI